MTFKEILVSLFRLFRRAPKPPPPPRQATLKWSGLQTLPNGGSMALQPGVAGQASPAWDVLPTLIPFAHAKLLRFTARLAAPVEGGIEIMLYRYTGTSTTPAWCPRIPIAAGQSSGEYVFTGPVGIDAPEGLLAWISYPPGAGNTKPLDVFAEVTLEEIPG